MKRAFWDLIKSDLEATPQRFDHILKLIVEIGDRLCMFTPRRKDLRQEIRDVLDEKHLRQLFIHGAFDADEFGRVCFFIMSKLEAYSAPADKPQIKGWNDEQSKKLQGGIEYAEWIPPFIEGVHHWLDVIQERVASLIKK